MMNIFNKLTNRITERKYNLQRKKYVRVIRDEVISEFTLFMLLLAIVAIIINPVPWVPREEQHIPEQKEETKVDTHAEDELSFVDEVESEDCLEWLNTTPSDSLRKALRKAHIRFNCIDTLVLHRPYDCWTRVFYLHKVGIPTIEKLITAWRNEQ